MASSKAYDYLGSYEYLHSTRVTTDPDYWTSLHLHEFQNSRIHNRVPFSTQFLKSPKASLQNSHGCFNVSIACQNSKRAKSKRKKSKPKKKAALRVNKLGVVGHQNTYTWLDNQSPCFLSKMAEQSNIKYNSPIKGIQSDTHSRYTNGRGRWVYNI